MAQKSQGQWFRMYEGILDNPKVQKLPPDIFKGWVNLLALAKRNGGRLPPSLSDIAFALRVPEVVAQKLLDAVRAAALFDATETGDVPHDWSLHQYESDVSTERVKRFRQRSKKQDETVSETPPEAETEQNRAEQSGAREADANEMNRLNRLFGFDERNFTAHAGNIRVLVDLKNDGCDFESHIWPAAQQAAKSGKARSLSYIRPRALELRDAAKIVAAMPTPFENTDLRGWTDRMRVFRETGSWAPKWGPKPDESGCKCPPEIMKQTEAA